MKKFINAIRSVWLDTGLRKSIQKTALKLFILTMIILAMCFACKACSSGMEEAMNRHEAEKAAKNKRVVQEAEQKIPASIRSTVTIGNYSFIPLSISDNQDVDVDRKIDYTLVIKAMDQFTKNHPELEIKQWAPQMDYHARYGGQNNIEFCQKVRGIYVTHSPTSMTLEKR